LKINSYITSLNLYDNFIKERIKLLSEILKVNFSITSFLHDNYVQKEGIRYLNKALCSNTILTDLFYVGLYFEYVY